MKGIFMALLMTTVLTDVFPWVLQTTYTNVIPKVTDDVSLRCFYDVINSAKSTIDQLTRIRLLKLGNSDIWNTFAEIVLPSVSTATLTDPSKTGIIIKGHLGKLTDSFLSVTWTTASVDTVGSYKCEIDGFTEKLRTNVQVNTRMVNITNNPVTTRDLLGIIIQMRNKSDKMTQELKSEREEHDIQHQNLTKYILHEIESSVQDDRFELRYWPMGNYAILSPASGCPETSFTKMNRGFFKIEVHMKMEPDHMISSPSHLDEDIFKNCGSRNVMHFRFCRYKDAKDLKLKWPRGTYCIPYSNGCPEDFSGGTTQLPLETSTDLIVNSKHIGNPITYLNGSDKSFSIHFCCRNDGDADVPVLLPNAKPFYLYRYKGTCQKVFDMSVTNEWIKFDTNDGKPNKQNNNYHADGDLKEGRVELCYYSKTSQP